MATLTARTTCICVFAKPPQPGVGKTRLIPMAGAEGASALARAFLLDTLADVERMKWAQPVLASVGDMPPDLVPVGWEVWQQGEGDLGKRLESILRRALTNFDAAIAIGADTPGLPMTLLEAAQHALRSHDAVLGPCEDGGFYLIGVKQCPEGLLANIGWSQASTMAATQARLEQFGLSIKLLDLWSDVDTPQDLEKLRDLLAAGSVEAPHTAKELRSLSLGQERPARPRLSVVIPVLDEKQFLPQTLASLRRQPWIEEIVVADGGSTDGTREWLTGQTDLRVVNAVRGKGGQLNAGARHATGEVLLFLHADCLLPVGAGAAIAQALRDPAAVGGCFYTRFAETRPWLLRPVATGINLRSRLRSSGTGDQALFVRREIFERLQGFKDWPLFEDVDFVNRAKRLGSFVVNPLPVTVSARRYVSHGILKTVLLIYALRLGYWLGVSPFRLKRWFGDVRVDVHETANVRQTSSQTKRKGLCKLDVTRRNRAMPEKRKAEN